MRNAHGVGSLGRSMAVLLAIGAFAVPAASAETVTIGNPLTHTNNFALGACTVPCTAVQRTQDPASSTLPLTSPVNGVITQWSVRTTFVGASFRLRVLRPMGGLNYQFVATGPVSPDVPNSS